MKKIVILVVVCIILVSIFAMKTNDSDMESASDIKESVELKEYDSITDFPYDDMEFLDKSWYEILENEYKKIDFSSTFIIGDVMLEEKSRDKYYKLINEESPFLYSETQEKLYLSELGKLQNFPAGTYKINELKYYYFDVDGDNVSELGVTNGVQFRCIFDYDESTDQVVLWKNLYSTWYGIMGTKKIYWNNGGTNKQFVVLQSNGLEEIKVSFFELNHYDLKNDKEEVVYMVGYPWYVQEDDMEEMKEQAYCTKDNRYYFRVTKEQYEALINPYERAEVESKENIKAVTFTYDEILEKLQD